MLHDKNNMKVTFHFFPSMQELLLIFLDCVYRFLENWLMIIRNDIIGNDISYATIARVGRCTCNNCTIIITRATVPPPIERRSYLSWEIRARVGRPRGNGRYETVGFSRGARSLFVATVCRTAGVRSPCAGVRRIDNLFTISARARTSTRVRWRTTVMYAVTRNSSSVENHEKMRYTSLSETTIVDTGVILVSNCEIKNRKNDSYKLIN